MGHDGFLDRYVVSFNYSENYFVVEDPGDWMARMPIDPYDELERRGDPEWQRPQRD